jgi:pre-mRNA-splicing factor ATP-dependent RNA helicase DHX38/PRP16
MLAQRTNSPSLFCARFARRSLRSPLAARFARRSPLASLAARFDLRSPQFFVPESDHCTLLNVYLRAKQHGFKDDWCTKHFVHSKGMQKAREVRAQLVDLMQQQKIVVKGCGGSWDVVRRTICSAYFYNSCQIKGIGEYVNMLTGIQSCLHPSSALYGLGYTPDFVVYHELISTSKEYMSCVTAVDGQWLAELGPMFFSIKESFATRIAKKSIEAEREARMKAEMDKAQGVMDARKAEKEAEKEGGRRDRKGGAAVGGGATLGRSGPKFMPKRRIGM